MVICKHLWGVCDSHVNLVFPPHRNQDSMPISSAIRHLSFDNSLEPSTSSVYSRLIQNYYFKSYPVVKVNTRLMQLPFYLKEFSIVNLHANLVN